MTSRSEPLLDGRPRPLLNVDELGLVLGISRASVYRFIRSGEIPTVRVGERIRFRPEDVEAYLDREREPDP